MSQFRKGTTRSITMTDHRGKGPSFSDLEPQVKARLHLINHRVCTEIEQGIKELRTKLRKEGRPEEIFADGPKYYKQVLPDRGKELLEEIGKDIRERSIIFTPADGKRLEELVGNIFAGWLNVGQEHFTQFASEIGHGFEDIIDPGLQYIASVLGAALTVTIGELRTYLLSSATFPTLPGTKWEDIEIHKIDGHTIRVRVKRLTKSVTYVDLGCKDGRRKDAGPDLHWDLLMECIEDGAIVRHLNMKPSETAQNPEKVLRRAKVAAAELTEKKVPSSSLRDRIGKQKSRLSERLCTFFGIDSEPFSEYDHVQGWRPRFKIDRLAEYPDSDDPYLG